MKTRQIALALFLSAAASVGAEGAIAASEIAAASAVSKVLVYADRAIVSRTFTGDLAAGENRLVFDNLPERTEPSSLQVKGSGKAVLQDTIFRTKYYSEFPDEKIQALVKVKEGLDSQIQLRGDRIARANAEKGVLEKIIAKITAQVSGQQPPELSPDKWIQVINFYRDRLAALDAEIRGAEAEIRGLNLDLQKNAQELGQLQPGRQMKKNQAVVILSAPEASKATLTLSYIVYGPSWQPTYDLRVDSETKSLELSYNANVIQNSGEDWSGVSLALSTARPEIGGAQPELAPWYLSAYVDRPVPRSAAAGAPAPAPAMNQMYAAAPEEKSTLQSMADSDIAATNATVTKGAIAFTFTISGIASIASDNTSHRVSIMTKSLGATFRYSTAPKLSMHAYLKAKVVNQTDYPFLPGVTKVFLDGNFVANSRMDLVAPAEEFWTFLGVDEGVKVEYKRLKLYKDDQGVFSKKTRYVYEYETKITNNKKTDAEIVMWDQLPVSTDQKIVVKLINPNYVKDTDSLMRNNQDFLEWLLTLKPQETRTIGFSFSVEYPVGTNVSGL